MSYKELFSAIECNRIVIIEDDFKQGEYKKERALYDITRMAVDDRCRYLAEIESISQPLHEVLSKFLSLFDECFDKIGVWDDSIPYGDISCAFGLVERINPELRVLLEEQYSRFEGEAVQKIYELGAKYGIGVNHPAYFDDLYNDYILNENRAQSLRIYTDFSADTQALFSGDIGQAAPEHAVVCIIDNYLNSGGVSLKQNDFILTLLSLYWDEGRREIERFSKESTTPCKGKTTSYNPLTTVSAQDVIRVVMAYAFDRARLKYGYKLLRGADFDRKGAVDENLRTTRFDILKERLPDVLDVHSWHEFIKAIMNAGYLSGEMILSGNAIFYTYALYLIAKHRFHASYNEDMHLTSLWFFYASLVSLYTGSFESTVEKHLNTIKGLKTLSEYKEFILSRINERLTNDFFDITLVGSEGLAVSGRGNNAWNAYVASLNIMNAKILFSKSNLFVSKLFEPGTDGNRKSLEKHHLFPKAYLKSLNCTDAKINQMANYALIDWKDNMDILDDAPSVYYPIICAGMSDEQIRVMEEENALPHGWENMSYDDFLIERRKLMAAKIKIAFEVLKKAVTE